MTQLIANGNAYSDDGSTSRDMQHGGFRSWLLPMLRDVLHDAAASSGNADSAEQSAQAAQQSAIAAALAAQAAEDAIDAIENIGSGWTPVIGIAIDGQRMVLQIRDWTGGRGPKPATGYIGEAGLVPNIGDGLNIRGAVSYNDLADKPPLGTAAALNVPAAAAGIATPAEVVRGDDPRLTGGVARGALTITTSQNIDKSIFGNATILIVRLRGGGASGCAAVQSSAEVSGGEGGNSELLLLRIADLPASISCVVGAGGASVTTTSTSAAGNPGGDTSFAGFSVKGGVASSGSIGASNIAYKAGDAGAGAGNGSNSIAETNGRRVTGAAMPSVHGGGGGGSALLPPPGGSATAGRGGAGLAATVTGQKAENGVAPSGGGGGCRLLGVAGTATSGAGAPGNIEILWY